MQPIKHRKPTANFGLDKYIHCIIGRNIRVNDANIPIRKIIPPTHLTSLDFFFGNPFTIINLATGKKMPYKKSGIRGCRTFNQCAIEFNKPFSSISIKFTPTGLYNLLGIEMHTITNTDYSCKALAIPVCIDNIHKKLEQQTDFEQQAQIVEESFKDAFCKKNKEAILGSYHNFLEGTETERLYLSTRQAERLFLKEVGLSPKSYSNLRRFSNLLKAKKFNPQQNWTSLAHEFGYFDQSHFIKAFHTFLGITPRQFNMEVFAL